MQNRILKVFRTSVIVWIVAHGLVGFIVGYLESAYFQFIATLILTGIFLGIAQWFVLRTQGFSWRWIVVTSVGWLLGMMLQLIVPIGGLSNWLSENVGLWEVFWLNTLQMPFWVFPVLLGQWWLIRNRPHVSMWIALGLIGGGVQGAVGSLVASLLPYGLGAFGVGISYGLSWFAFGNVMVFAVITIFIGKKSKHQSN